ncbi:MAG: CehA/McbA family metallohydrolase [Alphaproteobacteria bacterium]|nr:CehA/McbA family metallohydrolase [Alphaproteobacteria bacterium]
MRPLTRLAPLLPALVAVACHRTDADDDDTDTTPAIDLVTPLGPTQARAGVITDPAILPGGLGGEGRPGDVALVNDSVRFVIQAAGRDSGGLVPYGGGVLDADVVRPDGTADEDLVVDWMPALDLGWLPDATAITVVADGTDGGDAIVEVTGQDASFAYMGAILENRGAYPPRGLTLVTRYTLPPHSPLMTVTTTITASAEAVELRPGDVLQSFPGVTSSWVPGVGRTAVPGAAEDAVMVVHDELGLALGLFADDADGSSTPEGSLDLLNFVVALTSLYEPETSLAPGATVSWTRYWGVARDPAALTDAWLAATGAATRTVTAHVVDPDGHGVAGVRVTALVDGRPFTLDLSDADGQVAMDVPATGTVRLVADGAGSRLVDDLPPGAGDVASLAEASRREASLATVRDGATPVPHARGWGRAEGGDGDDLVLTPPGTLTVTIPDAAAFQVRVRAVGEPPVDDVLGLPVPHDLTCLGHGRAGRVDLPVEPGTYDVTVWRGTVFEVHTEQVTVTSGATTTVDARDVLPAFNAPDWLRVDTHVHAVPSFDGKLSPTDRALSLAGTGVQVWFASEHDVAVDRAPGVAALGLDEVLHTVGSVEVTPWVRGHVNIFPNQADPDARAGGAWPWWEELGTTTTEQFERLLAHHPGVMVQVNHPFSPGMPQLAGWSPGHIDHPDLWWDGFDALEVIVPGMTPRGLELYLDLVNHGITPAVTGSTDSHDHITNDPGLLGTWAQVHETSDTIGHPFDELVAAAFAARRTVATNGPLLQLDPPPGTTLTAPTTLTVRAHAPSWMPVERVVLYTNGVRGTPVPIDRLTPVTFDLDGDTDTAFVVVLEADTPMRPLGGRPAWAVASALLLDVDGDGWDAPLGPYEE